MGDIKMKWFTDLFKKTKKPELNEKDLCTARKEPYVSVVNVHTEGNEPGNGYFELDWNSYFIVDLKKAGYTGNTEEEIVNQWLKQLCKNIANEDDLKKEIRIV
jgi:hypothetical protein